MRHQLRKHREYLLTGVSYTVPFIACGGILLSLSITGATLMKKKLWSEQMHKAGIAALGMGFIGITEGAIPFAAADPLRVVPCVILGSSTGSVIAMLGGVGNQAPHGGPVVLPVVQNRFIYIVAIIPCLAPLNRNS